jgi:RNA polymerase-binding transcription factor DksA
MRIDEGTLKELTHRLLNRRAELLRALAEETAPADDVSEGREPRDEVDLATQETLQDPRDAIRESHHRELTLVDEALTRIADGSYGIDGRGREIPIERLRAIPWATS